MHTTQAVSDLRLDFKDSSSYSELLPRVLHLKGAQGLKGNEEVTDTQIRCLQGKR